MYTQGFMGWGYMRLCCCLVGSRSLIVCIHYNHSHLSSFSLIFVTDIMYYSLLPNKKARSQKSFGFSEVVLKKKFDMKC